MEVQQSDLFSNEFNSVEPSPRFPDDEDVNQDYLYCQESQRSVYTQIQVDLNSLQIKENMIHSNSFQQFKLQLLNSHNHKQGLDSLKLVSIEEGMTNDGDALMRDGQELQKERRTYLDTPLRESITESLNSHLNLKQIDALNMHFHSHQPRNYEEQLTQSNVHDFSFSQQLNNSSCAMADESQSISVYHEGSPDKSERRRRSNRKNKAKQNNQMILQEILNDHCMSSDRMQQSPPSNSQDITQHQNLFIPQNDIENQTLQESSYRIQEKLQNMDGVQLAFNQSLDLVKSKWNLFQEWPESSSLRIELFALEMQSAYGSYYRNKSKINDLLSTIVKEQSNKLAYLEAWKKKFKKLQRDTMLDYIQLVEKNRDFIETLHSTTANNTNTSATIIQNSQQQSSISNLIKFNSQSSTAPQTIQNLRQLTLSSNNSTNSSIYKRKGASNKGRLSGIGVGDKSQGRNQQMQHQQSLEDISPRQPPIMIQNTSSIANSNNQVINYKRKGKERGRSKTTPGVLQNQSITIPIKQATTFNIVNNIPKLDINSDLNNFYNSIDSHQQISAKQRFNINNDTMSSESSNLNKHYKSSKVLNESKIKQQVVGGGNLSISPNTRASASYKNPFQRLIKQKQKIKTLQSPSPSQVDTPKRHAFQNYEYRSPKQEKEQIQVYNKDLESVQSSQLNSHRHMTRFNELQMNQTINNSSSDEGPEVPYKLETDSLSIYSQNQLIQSINTEQLKKLMDQQEQVQALKMQQDQDSVEIQRIQEDKMNIEEDFDQFDKDHPNNSDQISQVLQDEDDLVACEDQIPTKNLIKNDNYINNIQSPTLEIIEEEFIMQNQNQIDEAQQIIIQEQFNDLIRKEELELENFIIKEILHSDRSRKEYKDLDHQNKQTIFQEYIETNNIDQAISQGLIDNEQFLSSQLDTQNTMEVQAEEVKKEVKSQTPQFMDVQVLEPQVIESISEINLDPVIESKDSNLELKYDDSRIIETEIVQDNYSQDTSQDNLQTFQRIKQINNLCLTPILRTKKQSLSFSKPSLIKNSPSKLKIQKRVQYVDQSHYTQIKSYDRNDDSQEEEVIQNKYEVFTQQDTYQQGRDYSPISISKINKINEKINFCFKNYIQLETENINLGFSNKPQDVLKSQKAIQFQEKSDINKIQNILDILEINTAPILLHNIIQAYNQPNSILHTLLLSEKSISDSIQYEDDSNNYFISQLRLDPQQAKDFESTFKITSKELKNQTLIRSCATFQIPDAKKLYQEFTFPSNRVYSSTGLTQIKQQLISPQSFSIYKILNKFQGLQASRSSIMLYQYEWLTEEDGIIVIMKTSEQYNSRFNLISKDFNNNIQILKMRTIESAKRVGQKDQVEIKLFYSVDYNLLIDDELRQNNFKIGLQEIKALMDAIKVYDREL